MNVEEVHLFHDAALGNTDNITEEYLWDKQYLSVSWNTENLKSTSRETRDDQASSTNHPECSINLLLYQTLKCHP